MLIKFKKPLISEKKYLCELIFYDNDDDDDDDDDYDEL